MWIVLMIWMANYQRGSKDYNHSQEPEWLPVYKQFSSPHQAILHKEWARGAPSATITLNFPEKAKKPWLMSGTVNYSIEFGGHQHDRPMVQTNMTTGVQRRTGWCCELPLWHPLHQCIRLRTNDNMLQLTRFVWNVFKFHFRFSRATACRTPHRHSYANSVWNKVHLDWIRDL